MRIKLTEEEFRKLHSSVEFNEGENIDYDVLGMVRLCNAYYDIYKTKEIESFLLGYFKEAVIRAEEKKGLDMIEKAISL